MNTIRGIFVTSILVFATATAMADNGSSTTTQTPTQKKTTLRKGKRVASRRTASDSSSNLRVTRRSPREQNWQFTIAGLGGVTTPASGNLTSGSFGGAVDVRAYRYFGFEADGFYATGPTTSASHFDVVQGKYVNDTQSQKQYAAQAALKGQLPLHWQSMTFTPKLGVGYGMLGMRTTSNNADGSGGNDSVNVYGPYAVAGLDIEPLSSVLVSADYSHSFAASGMADSIDTTSARFDRIRAGAYYRFTPNVMIGAQYQRRNLDYTVSGASATETLNQFLGVAALTF